MSPLPFLKQVLQGEKLLKKKNQVFPLPKVERYAELSLHSVLEYCRDQNIEIFQYLPDNPEPAKLDRQYCLEESFL